ncbi:MAG: hypothetical protein COX65_03150 [Elusimicrobia bacterium CG_4_10_14_0_2_um_filter_56_8]|nr:MAG: hypothetical protein AUJ51_02475 [Elusimicrobia bacterium CG1_02_56_21]PJA16193.1 MAG: hypothetical protein COX65_03150 [Elusimicrobia bacterium CG_4_10_14_0_2_um_filter_56_8]
MPERTTRSLCPVCKKQISAEIKKEGFNVYLHKNCPEHGKFRVLISKDAARFSDKTFSSPGKPFKAAIKAGADPGCPDNCGWCSSHKQHICTGLIEITGACDMACPICYFGSKTGGFISTGEFSNRLRTLLEIENGALEVLQISGGEPLLHPEFGSILALALAKNIKRILVNTNGLRLLEDEKAYQAVKKNRDRAEIYLQFDGFDENSGQKLRAGRYLEAKEKLISKLDEDGIKICLAVTVYAGNLSEIPRILKRACEVKNISGITFQRLAKQGSAFATGLETVCQEDILQAMAGSGLMRYKDIIPLPCSHENCTSLAFLLCSGKKIYSLGEYLDYSKCTGVLSDRVAFDGSVLDYLRDNACRCFPGWLTGKDFIAKSLARLAGSGKSSDADLKVLRIMVKNFMDCETFDFERAQKCCVGVSSGSGRVVPFCVHNNLKSNFQEVP